MTEPIRGKIARVLNTRNRTQHEADSRVKTGDPVVQVLKTGEANQ